MIVYINYNLYDNIATILKMDGLGLLRCICDETRFGILEELGGGEKTVGQIVQKIKRDQPLVSHHLRTLRECGIVSSRNSGRNVMYSISSRHLSDLIAQIRKTSHEMNDICCVR